MCQLSRTVADRIRPIIGKLQFGRGLFLRLGQVFSRGIYELAQRAASQLRLTIAKLRFGGGAFLLKAVTISGLCAISLISIEALVREYRNLKIELAAARSELAASRERISRLEIWAAGMVSDQTQSQHGGPVRVGEGDARLRTGAPDAPFELSGDEVRLMREYIKVPPAPAGATPTIVLGALVDEQRLLPLPPQIGDKFPVLVGARFTTDRNGAIIIVRRGSRRANSVVSPTN